MYICDCDLDEYDCLRSALRETQTQEDKSLEGVFIKGKHRQLFLDAVDSVDSLGMRDKWVIYLALIHFTMSSNWKMNGLK